MTRRLGTDTGSRKLARPPQISVPPTTAAGVPAVVSSLRHVFSVMNPVRGVQTLARINQTHGFDCPGCAWPDPDDRRSLVEFCENGAKAIAEEATRKRLLPAHFAQYSIATLASLSDHDLGHLGRLTHPMVKRPGDTHYAPIAWNDAFALVAAELQNLDSPDQATFYTSGRTSNEAAFLYQLFIRLFGTNNLPDCSNLCHESSGVGLTETIGVGKGTVRLEDFDLADCILVMGQNPGTNHPRMLTALQRAARGGCRIISVNPLQEAGMTAFANPQEVGGFLGTGTPLAEFHVPVRINGDVAWLQGVMKVLLELEAERGGVVDHAFIAQHTTGFAALTAHLAQTDWATITTQSGISQAEIAQVAGVIAGSKRLIVCWAMGLTQHKNAVANVQEVVNLLLLGGHLGRPGAGACPVRGHSNVQGDRTMGIYEKPAPAFLDALGQEFAFAPPREHGLDAVDSIRAMVDGRVRVFVGMGGNFLSASPDTALVAKALTQCQLTVHIATKLNRAHLTPGQSSLILPCLGRTEIDEQASGPQCVTVENSMGIVHASRGHLTPASAELRSEVAIVCGLGQALFGDDQRVDWPGLAADYSRIRDHIARVIPGFTDFNAKVAAPHGFYLPNAVRDNLHFATPDAKAHFTVHPITPIPLEPGQFLLMTVRSHDQYNTTIYGLHDRYRGIAHGRRVVLMHPEDARALGVDAGALVDLTSHWDGATRHAPGFVVVPYQIPRGCLASYFPEANVLVPLESVAEKSNTPAYKSIVVSVGVGDRECVHTIHVAP